jgi:hypothetical protein
MHYSLKERRVRSSERLELSVTISKKQAVTLNGVEGCIVDNTKLESRTTAKSEGDVALEHGDDDRGVGVRAVTYVVVQEGDCRLGRVAEEEDAWKQDKLARGLRHRERDGRHPCQTTTKTKESLPSVPSDIAALLLFYSCSVL